MRMLFASVLEWKVMRALGLLVVLVTACKSQDNTNIVVEVWSDLAVPSQMDAIRIDAMGATSTSSKMFALGGPNQLPVRLTLVPEDAKNAGLTVRTSGLSAMAEIVWQAAQVAFVPGESKLLTLTLEKQCASAGCSPIQSCAAGVCTPVPVITNLPGYDPKATLVAPAMGGAGGPIAGAGGAPGTGGLTGTGGTLGTGDLTGTGGTLGTGHLTGTAGTIAATGGTGVLGGLTGVAGIANPGGMTAPGGMVVVGGTGAVATAGRIGGSVGTGGTQGTGGVVVGGTSSVRKGGSTGGTGVTGGTQGTGGSTGVCAPGPVCGGDVVGTWQVTSTCLWTDGPVDISTLSLGCRTAAVTGSLSVTGTMTLGPDGSYTDKTVTTGQDTWRLGPECLSIQGTKVMCDGAGIVLSGLLGNYHYQAFSCVDAAGGGCLCQGMINQAGGMGMLSDDLYAKGKYTTSTTSTLTLGDVLTYSFCATGTKMTVMPQPAAYNGVPFRGTVDLQRIGTGTGGTGGSSGVSTVPELPPPPTFTGLPLPCEAIAADGIGAKCVSAHSTVRVIVPGYSGPLYQLCKGGSKAGPSSCTGTPQDVSAISGYADVVTHEAFCGTEACTVTKIYDQSGMGNDLEPGPKGGAKQTPDNPAKAMALPIKIDGHKAYGLLMKAGMGYRTGCNTCTLKKGNGMPLGDEPQLAYMVTSQKDAIDGCCFEYGNAETTCNDDGNGNIEAVYFGGGVVWGTGYGGKPGPWVMADLENGTYAGWDLATRSDKNIATNRPLKFDFVTAVVVGDTAEKNNGKGRFALYGADGQGRDATFGKLTCMYDGIRPEKAGYVPAQKQGSLVLNISGDNSNGGGGRFFEGAVVAGPLVSQTTLAFLQAVIAAAKYENAD